jgi:hypothetical protein
VQRRIEVAADDALSRRHHLGEPRHEGVKRPALAIPVLWAVRQEVRTRENEVCSAKVRPGGSDEGPVDLHLDRFEGG